jgi:pimeloyl-ACP methyl ester carboxylesterase
MGDVAARTLGRVGANGIELAYETFGDASAPPVVLIMGLATQMIAWPDELCDGLARCGLFVVRFDNRDVGGSTHLRNCRRRALPASWCGAGRRRIRSGIWPVMWPG